MHAVRLLSLLALAASAQGSTVDVAQLPGNWRGEGHYYEVKLQRGGAPPAFELAIAPDLTLSGTVGAARVVPAQPVAIGRRIDYQVVLVGAVDDGKFLKDKDHLMILVTVVDGGRMSADFHLKSRFGFDFSMHPGSLEAIRSDRR